ncbi:endonuclease/exonuclease/phosphatase family protein [Chlorobium sp. N1]|uniref:endonuclease/exonuclease/phosphatase family protein n=1 Tax=Chlorobium sp. N1 TaxID=2491138 RepID=UPI00103CC05F|nr:endonuclease/exonuclease/phosphatase family protein [Chlorobium sp. N1]TCD47167.1 endonuclease/exonuclease/phosphatase family protein [Chlorobium sp. N1]
MITKKILAAFLLLLPAMSLAEDGNKTVEADRNAITMLWWNVENLFDTIDDPTVSDEDFTPGGRLHWTPKKLLLKQTRIAYVMKAVKAHPDYGALPDILAFAEVENRRVFEASLNKITGGRYHALYHDSPDMRGIDIALAYDPRTIVPLTMKPYRVKLEGRPTRDILVASFSAGGHPFTLILNHWPSRAFDASWTEKKRIAAARVARAAVDSLLQIDPGTDIIVMGDFNDGPEDPSVRTVLRSTLNRKRALESRDGILYNCWDESLWPGSYAYRGRWSRIDQILVSRGLLESDGLRLIEPRAFSCFAFRPMFTKSGKRPWRTYEGSTYSGGYSDHLPLLLRLETR